MSTLRSTRRMLGWMLAAGTLVGLTIGGCGTSSDNSAGIVNQQPVGNNINKPLSDSSVTTLLFEFTRNRIVISDSATVTKIQVEFLDSAGDLIGVALVPLAESIQVPLNSVQASRLASVRIATLREDNSVQELFTTPVVAQVGQQTTVSSATGANATLTALSVNPSAANINQGGKLQMVANATFTSGSQSTPVFLAPANVSWDSSNSTVANVDRLGLVVGGGTSGEGSITASYGGLTGAAVINNTGVPEPSQGGAAQVFLANNTVAVGSTVAVGVNLTVEGVSSNVTGQATIQSADQNVATVSGSQATGVGVGTTSITATVNGTQAGPATLTVTSAPVP